jgi:uncharacterized repeat protein (TIGR03843 family)
VSLTDVKENLMNGELRISGRLVDASNATLFGTSTWKDTSLDIIYKPIAGERPLWDFAEGNLASRELAAYLLSELAGWQVVPTTVLRDGPFGEGMVQEWIEIDEEIDLAEFYRTQDPRLRTLALFDAVINNTDRKIGHLLLDKKGNLFGCDHGVTFHQEDKLRTVLWQWATTDFTDFEKEQLRKLAILISKKRDLFENLLSSAEIHALSNRISRLLESGVFPSPSEDWPAIPWPPF